MTYLRIYSPRPLTFIIILRQAQVNKGIKNLIAHFMTSLQKVILQEQIYAFER